MNKKILLALATISLLACNFLFPSTPAPTAAPSQIVETPSPTLEPPTQTSDRFTLVRFHKQDGELKTILAAEAQKAAALGRMPIVYFDATWCPPCEAIKAALEAENPLMMDAYADTYIIELDVDEWGWDNGQIGDFQFEFIPVYFKLDSNGNQTGEVIDGGAWGEDIPENIAPVMSKFFHGG